MLVVAALAGLLIGLSLGALGGGGSILAVPVLVYLLGESPVAATTGSLLVVGVSSLAGAIAAWREGHVYVARGIVFGVVGSVGAVVGAKASVHVDPKILLASFAVLMLLVAGVMLLKTVRSPDRRRRGDRAATVEEPIVTISPRFMCNCPRALKVLVTALLVGVLTGFLGVGGGFLVVPALVLALGLPMPVAAGTSLAVITLNSASALAARLGSGAHLEWPPVVTLTLAAVVGGLAGARLASRLQPRRLGLAFSVLLVAVACYTAWQSIPALLG